MIRIVLPYHLQNLARIEGEVVVELTCEATLCSVLDALEVKYPMLRGAIREHATKERRAFVRYFVCEEDWSHEATDKPLPKSIALGTQPLIVLGAIAGG